MVVGYREGKKGWETGTKRKNDGEKPVYEGKERVSFRVLQGLLVIRSKREVKIEP